MAQTNQNLPNKSGFIDPKSIGIETPINTPQELVSISRAMNAHEYRSRGLTPPWERNRNAKKPSIPGYVKVSR